MFWQIIAANKRRTIVLILGMGAVLALFGFALGLVVFWWSGLSDPAAMAGIGRDAAASHAGWVGMGIALMVWLMLMLVSLYGSDQLFLFMAGAREIDQETFPQLYNVVEEMKIAAALPYMPRIFIVDDMAPNAFALGKSPVKAMICVTAGLLATCSRDELQGVVAHELGHILNRDVLYLTVAATMLGSITFLADFLWRAMLYSPSGRYRSSRSSSSKGSGLIGVAILAICLIFLVLSPVLARLLYFSLSRRREYLADATSARLTRYPEGLASALEKIMHSKGVLKSAPAITAPFYIANPYRQDLHDGLFATHPPLGERIKILRMMTSGAGFVDYTKAYQSVTRNRTALIPAADIKPGEQVAVREPSAIGAEGAAPVFKQAGDIIRTMHDFTFINCTCGMKIKVPPEFPADTIRCPRCSREHAVSMPDRYTKAGNFASAAAFTRPQIPAGSAPQTEQRHPGTWQSFVCSACGNTIQISPSFGLNEIKCIRCNHKIVFA